MGQGACGVAKSPPQLIDDDDRPLLHGGGIDVHRASSSSSAPFSCGCNCCDRGQVVEESAANLGLRPGHAEAYALADAPTETASLDSSAAPSAAEGASRSARLSKGSSATGSRTSGAPSAGGTGAGAGAQSPGSAEGPLEHDDEEQWGQSRPSHPADPQPSGAPEPPTLAPSEQRPSSLCRSNSPRDGLLSIFGQADGLDVAGAADGAAAAAGGAGSGPAAGERGSGQARALPSTVSVGGLSSFSEVSGGGLRAANAAEVSGLTSLSATATFGSPLEVRPHSIERDAPDLKLPLKSLNDSTRHSSGYTAATEEPTGPVVAKKHVSFSSPPTQLSSTGSEPPVATFFTDDFNAQLKKLGDGEAVDTDGEPPLPPPAEKQKEVEVVKPKGCGCFGRRDRSEAAAAGAEQPRSARGSKAVGLRSKAEVEAEAETEAKGSGSRGKKARGARGSKAVGLRPKAEVEAEAAAGGEVAEDEAGAKVAELRTMSSLEQLGHSLEELLREHDDVEVFGEAASEAPPPV